MNDFPVGSLVRFRRLTYEVKGFDGESLELETLDPETDPDLRRLFFPPEMFEMVRPPFPETNTVWIDSQDRYWVVREVDRFRNVVWIAGQTAQSLGLSLEQFGSGYRQVI